MEIGVYLEAGYRQEGEALFCEDIYAVLFNELSQDKNISFSFVGRQCESKTGNMYRLDRYNRFFELTPYRDLTALCKQWSSFKRKNRATLEEFVQSVDKLLIMSPMPICIEVMKLGVKYNKPMVLLARQDTRRMLPQRFSGVKKWVATLLAYALEHRVERLVSRHNIAVMALGNTIALRFRKFTDKVYYISTSPYRLSDVISPEEIRPIDWNGVVKMLFVGRVEINKGLQELLACLAGGVPFKWSLTIVGDGAFMPQVRRLIAQYGVASKVELAGYIPFGDKLMQIYKSHDILVLPSYSEGLPQVLSEAMAGGCLVVATNVGGIPDMVKPGQTGLLFTPKSVEALKRIFAHMWEHRTDMEDMRLQALDLSKNYALDNQIDVLRKQLDSSR